MFFPWKISLKKTCVDVTQWITVTQLDGGQKVMVVGPAVLGFGDCNACDGQPLR